ncbi:hypothetical protein BGX28_009573 [Mortierella sp. GBA30]|nr:hypothetical protein BGX28_009573 [Mortierella sp. GBA30]
MHRLSQLSSSTMDDDLFSLSSRHSLSELDTPCCGTTRRQLSHGDRLPTLPFESTVSKTERNAMGDYAIPTCQPTTTVKRYRRPGHSSSSSFCSEGSSMEDIEPMYPANNVTNFLDPRHESLDDPQIIIERPISDQDKKASMSMLFSRATSNGDLQRTVDMLENFREWIDIESTRENDDGFTPLIYAASFGHTAIAFMLLDAGAKIEASDKFGWTALIWATNNKHEHIVRLLLDHGASSETRTSKGWTVADFLRHDPNDNTKIAQIFREPGQKHDHQDYLATMMMYRSHRDILQQRRTEEEDAEGLMIENHWQYRKLKNAMVNPGVSTSTMAGERSVPRQGDDDDDFDWTNCLPDQMFVFSDRDINHLVKITITAMEVPQMGQYEPVPAYVIFLAARFAHYYSTPELLDELLEATLSAIEFVTKCKTGDIAFITYWVSNACTLLHFLRKDPGLNCTSGVHQPKFTALVQDMIQMMVIEAQRGIDRVLEPAMLEHDTIMGLEEVKFQSDWALGFWKGGSNGQIANKAYKRASTDALQQSTLTPLSPQIQMRTFLSNQQKSFSTTTTTATPRTLTTMLSSILFLMRSYDFHPEIIHYVTAQLLHYISSEIFNHMMGNRRFLSRSKALQTRLNLSILEDWLRNNKMPSKLMIDQLAPLIQLLQLLQVLSQQTNLTTWVETRRKLGLLNHAQVQHVVSVYRYEVKENRLPTEITQYVVQFAIDMGRIRDTRQSTDMKDSQNQQRNIHELSSSSSICSSARTSMQQTRSSSNTRHDSQSGMTDEDDFEDNDDDGDDDDATIVVSTISRSTCANPKETLPEEKESEDEYLLSETRDSKSWIPFIMPENLAARGACIERVYVPHMHVPEEMLKTRRDYM